MGVSTPQFSATATGRFLMYQGNQEVFVDAATALSNLGATTASDVAAISDFFRGLSYSQNASTPTAFIDVTAGACRDSLNTYTINLASTMTKDITAAWVAGTGNGSLDTGSISNGFCHIHAIYNPTSDVSDILTSTSMTAPTMPSGYTARRWLGAFVYFAGIYDFITLGEWHFYKTRTASVSSAANNTTATNRLLLVPIGAKCEVEVYLQVNDSTFTSGPGGSVTVRDPDLGTYTPSASTGDWYYNPGKIFATRARLFTSNTGYVSTGDSNTSGTGLISISTEGWRIDRSVYR